MLIRGLYLLLINYKDSLLRGGMTILYINICSYFWRLGLLVFLVCRCFDGFFPWDATTFSSESVPKCHGHFGLFLKSLGFNFFWTHWKLTWGETFSRVQGLGNFQQTAQVPKNQIIHLGVVNISCDASSYFFCFGSKRRWFSRIYHRGPLGFRLWDRNARIQSQCLVFGPPNEYISTKTCHQKNMVFFGSLLFAIFSYWKGVDPLNPPKIPFRGTCWFVFPGGGFGCLFVRCWFFFPKISGWTPGHEAGIYALAVSDRLVASGSKVGKWWWFGVSEGGERWLGRHGVLSFFFLHFFFRVFFWGVFWGGGDEKKTQNGFFDEKMNAHHFFVEDIIWGRSSRKDKGKRW